MSGFNINGIPMRKAYHVSGSLASAGYNLDGELVFLPCDIVVMSYNVQHFEGINSQEELQNTIVSKWSPDVIGLQEMPNQTPLPSIAQEMLKEYNVDVSEYLAIASKLSVRDVVSTEFSNQDPRDWDEWQEKRKYLKGYVEINNKAVCVINTHLSLTQEYTTAQMMELLDVVKNEPYFILTGDFNFTGLSVRDSQHISMYKPFVEAGYHLANCTNEAGFNKTYSSATVAKEQINLFTCADNIITSGNIDILTTAYDGTKFDFLNGDEIDHIPIISYLKIN